MATVSHKTICLTTQGGEKDVNSIAKMVINDWQRGLISYFYPPPASADDEENDHERQDQGGEKDKLQESEAISMTETAATSVGWKPSLNSAV